MTKAIALLIVAILLFIGTLYWWVIIRKVNQEIEQDDDPDYDCKEIKKTK